MRMSEVNARQCPPAPDNQFDLWFCVCYDITRYLNNRIITVHNDCAMSSADYIKRGDNIMIQSIVDIPEVTRHNKYNLDQLQKLPAGKALKLELPDQTRARTARGVVWNYCKRHKLAVTTHTERHNGTYNLYIWHS